MPEHACLSGSLTLAPVALKRGNSGQKGPFSVARLRNDVGPLFEE